MKKEEEGDGKEGRKEGRKISGGREEQPKRELPYIPS